MTIKIKLFLAVAVVAFLIGISTIISFEGANKIDVHRIPDKWKGILQTKAHSKDQDTNDLNNNNNNFNNNNNNINQNINIDNNNNNNNNQNNNQNNQNNNKNNKKNNNSGNPLNKIDDLYNKNEELNIKRSNEVREAMKFAWEKYKEFAWGHDELQPLTKDYKEWFGLGLSIVDSLDTLKIMGLEKEYEEGRDWVANDLQQSRNSGMSVSVFETIIRVLGSHVTMYGLTNDEMYLEKAIEIGDLLLKAFPEDHNKPFPASSLRLGTSDRSYPGWTGGCVILAEVATLFLEFNELSRISGDPKYKEYSDRVIVAISKMKPNIPGLLPVFLSQDGNGFCGSMISVGGLGDSYYEYLLKMWIYTNGEEEIYKRLFIESADNIIKHMYKVSPQGDGYITVLDYGAATNKQEHLTCFAGGMFALAAAVNITGDDKKSRNYMEVGEMVTKTCVKTYLTSPTGLGPESFHIDPNSGDIRWNGHGTLNWYILRPETVESLFILYRLTGDQQYQEWSWQIFEAIQDVCKKENGYAGLKNVDDRNALDNNQQSFFMAETLKYLYLSFQPSSVIPLDKFVFNTEAHPIQIPNSNK
ncbi:hypothetical protein ACTA71_002076 [Dictyostelium dimigraforme]